MVVILQASCDTRVTSELSRNSKGKKKSSEPNRPNRPVANVTLRFANKTAGRACSRGPSIPPPLSSPKDPVHPQTRLEPRQSLTELDAVAGDEDALC